MIDLNSVKDLLISGAKGAITERAKQEVTGWLKNKGLPTARDVVNAYAAQLKEQANGEKGWCWFRDSVFLPGVFSAALWATDALLDQIIAAQPETK